MRRSWWSARDLLIDLGQRGAATLQKSNLVSYRNGGTVTEVPSAVYPFGDVLALARQSWLDEMASRLEARGYPGYHRSDAAALRLLARGPLAVGQFGAALGITRQAARKTAAGLQQRGYATTARDPHDARQLNITLTPAGHDYAQAMTAVIAELNRDVASRADPAQLAAADTVLRAALFDDSTQQRAHQLPRPRSPGQSEQL